jgi:hypothetical protein
MEKSSFKKKSNLNLENHLENLFAYDQIFLATKINYYKLNTELTAKLTENLLFKNKILNQEIEILYPNHETLTEAKSYRESNLLFDKCLENSITFEFIMKILWHRIYLEPIVMKFISMRYSNYANNLYLSGGKPPQVANNNWLDQISFFHFI